MVLNLSLSPQAEAKLKARAAAAGVDVATYAARYLELMAQSPPSISALGAATSGMSDEEMGDFLEEEKHRMRAEKRAKNS